MSSKNKRIEDCDPDDICKEIKRSLVDSGVREIRLQAELEIKARETIRVRVPFDDVVHCRNGGYTTWQGKK